MPRPATLIAGTVAIIWACCGAPGRCEDAAAPTPAAAVTWSALIRNAGEPQRERAYRFLANKYPQFSTDVWNEIVKSCPDFATAVWPRVDMLIATKYSGVAELVGKLLRDSPQVQQAVTGLMLEKYPDLVQEIQQLQDVPDLGGAVAKLIRERHPKLLSDILDMLQRQYPRLLLDVQRQVVVKYPGLVADVSELLATSYPDLRGRVQQLISDRYPTVTAELLQVLTRPEADAPPPDAPAPAAAVGPPPPAGQ